MRYDKTYLLLLLQLFLVCSLFFLENASLLAVILKSILLLFPLLFITQRFNVIKKIRETEELLRSAVQGNKRIRLRTGSDAIFHETTFLINKIIEQYEEIEAEAVRSQLARKRFLSSISHDIRTPLTSIIGYIDALKDNIFRSEDEKQKYLHILSSKSSRLKEIIEDLFHMAKLDADEVSFLFQKLDLAEAIREVLIEFPPLIEKEKVSLSVELPPSPCFVYADATSIARIMTNLLKNSLCHGRDGKILKVSLSDKGEIYELAIQDQGKGIEARELLTYYGFVPYWGMTGLWGEGSYPKDISKRENETEEIETPAANGEAHLRSAVEVIGYSIQATDSEFGYVEDFILEEDTWRIRYIVVNTKSFWFGKKVLISPNWITNVDWETRKVYINLSKDNIKSGPEYNSNEPITEKFEKQIRRYV
ncbi:histidine kinase dimerization/phospho-acceptor domain-containing protein [Priestia endophytica]|uniref:histidine kinase dimerization/phospho-acceptor domain-containing protein n=1 Tax=Priestia endophytica TaxID=135735 RepID=UPI002281BF37|nr:histidine kinase dimerization/phospho-acceptor domain-containing protein [Priestia endophytica]MCY8234566.1 PRC-barrel domain-containing protein [Priestia endophytica]